MEDTSVGLKEHYHWRTFVTPANVDEPVRMVTSMADISLADVDTVVTVTSKVIKINS